MLEKGITYTNEITVTEEMSAKIVGSGTLDVYATPAMIALMEKTAMECVAEQLEEGQGTVGIQIAVDHVSATPLGMKVRCKAVLEEVDGKKLTFSVSAEDEAGLIGKGTHQRFIVNENSFQQKADGKSN